MDFVALARSLVASRRGVFAAAALALSLLLYTANALGPSALATLTTLLLAASRIVEALGGTNSLLSRGGQATTRASSRAALERRADAAVPEAIRFAETLRGIEARAASDRDASLAKLAEEGERSLRTAWRQVNAVLDTGSTGASDGAAAAVEQLEETLHRLRADPHFAGGVG